LLDKLVPKVREHYVEHFRAFVAQQKSTGKSGAAEVKFALPADSPVFGHIHCADYVENDDGHLTVRWMQPDKRLAFPRFSELIDGASVDVVSMSWDDVVVSFDGAHPDYATWFDTWFDPNERDFREDAEFTGKIHSLSVGESDVVVDFGTAPPEALIDLIDLIIAAGSKQLTLTTTR